MQSSLNKFIILINGLIKIYSNKKESREDIYKHLNHKKYFFYNDLFWNKVGRFG
jgi:hypothetical protein